MSFELKAIVAVAENLVIGKDNDLIWRLSSDLQFFKRTTQGHCIISGRKNYESIGRPLPGRTNIIITRDSNYEAEGCVIVNSLEAAIEHAKSIVDESPFIIGGGEIYKLSLPYVKTLYYTEVHESFEGDTFFPELGSEWREVHREKGVRGEKDQCEFSFVTYENQNPSEL